METTKEHFVKCLNEEGFLTVRIRNKEEDKQWIGCLEFVTNKGLVLLVDAIDFDYNAFPKKGLDFHKKKIMEIKDLTIKRNKLNSQISTLKRAELKMECISCGKLFAENGYLECDECLEKNALKKATFGG